MSLLVDGFKEAINLLTIGDESVYSAIITTITVSSWSIFISLIIGLPLGFLLGYYNFYGKTVIKTIVDTLLAFSNSCYWAYSLYKPFSSRIFWRI